MENNFCMFEGVPYAFFLYLCQQFKCCGLKALNLEHKSSSDKSCFVDNDTTKERLKVG